jgi:hypothetical protein
MTLAIYVLALCFAVQNAPEHNHCTIVGVPRSTAEECQADLADWAATRNMADFNRQAEPDEHWKWSTRLGCASTGTPLR